MRRRALLPLVLAGLLTTPVASLAAPAAALPEGAGTQGEPARGTGTDLTPVSNWKYKGGTDLEFATIKGRDYAVAPAQGAMGGLRMFDLTANPAKPKLVGFLPCGVSQNDVQVRGTTVFLGVDGSVKSAPCFELIGAKPALGVIAIDISNPAKPSPIGFVGVQYGAHNSTLHPSGKFLYVSDSELTPKTDAASPIGRIDVYDISNAKKMKMINRLNIPTGLSSHDLTFNKKGTRAYSAALTATLILDTTNPAKPTIKTTIPDPATNISHGADLSPDETHLYVTDEQAGAAANGVCNVGGVTIFDITNELVPVKTGFYAFSPVNSLTATTNSNNIRCTAHVLDFGPGNKTFSNAGYSAGVRIVDLVGRVGIPKELASFTPLDADTWSAKQYKNGKYLYANDLKRGFDVYLYTPGKGAVDTRSAMEIRYDVNRIGSSYFGKGAWCANPTGREVAAHHTLG